ncbi:MAG: hypothetical protein DI536_35980 [Archangium gephyra]|uniref:Uncharacterized protein n=1 Tax=Archangium gephyra TaxID=48 RepID=A0A2W5UJK4_9BACT|nr:MAG: hypothetical protein DI536_35980 [Archangium gephyra]
MVGLKSNGSLTRDIIWASALRKAVDASAESANVEATLLVAVVEVPATANLLVDSKKSGST